MIDDAFELLGVGLDVLCLAALVAFSIWLPLLIVREFIFQLPSQRKRRRFWYCQTCGYNLKANTSGVCPECGTSIRKTAV